MASVAGIHGVLTGRPGHGPADRYSAGELLRTMPGAVTAAYQNRRFLECAVQFLAACEGIRQFVDIGCGLPAAGAVHDVALRIAPGARVAYVDHDPAVISALDAPLAGYPTVRAVAGDLRRPGGILGHPELAAFIDMAEPVAVVLTAVLHFVADDADPGGIVAGLVQAVAPGSCLVLSHAAGEYATAAAIEDARGIYGSAAASFAPRGHAEIAGFFDGLEIMPPGIVGGATWRPGYLATDPRGATFYAGLGKKR
ncbi:MAG TPA: SAM-dependent methyltransferase [Streptosporangiaceae bacterium]|nr:SAM-dependent methyltransferase [Streptosporangiaceae bacterium]